MAFYSIRAYFTGYKFVPDPEPAEEAPVGRPLHPDMTSIVETIVREQADKEPEDQAATAEGDVTFSDLIEQYDKDALDGPPPLPSVLDGPASFDPGALFDNPQERLVDNDDGGLGQDEDAEMESKPDAGSEPDDWLSEMGLMGQGDMSQDRSLQGQPATGDRLGLDDMFGQGDSVETGDADMGGMFGGEPGYEDLVGEALGESGEDSGDILSGEPEAEEIFDEMEDLLPVDEDDIVGPVERGDRGFAKSVLLADERMAESAARKVLASDVTININVGEGPGEDEELGEGLADAGEELGEGLEGAADELGEKLEGAAEELEGEEEGLGEELDLGEGEEELDLGEGEELDLGGFGEEAESILRRILANDVTININIGEGGEVDLEAPEDLLEPELDLGEDLDEEDLGELDGIEDEGLGEEMEVPPSKKGEGESFDELNDVEDVFGDENDKISEFGI